MKKKERGGEITLVSYVGIDHEQPAIDANCA